MNLELSSFIENIPNLNIQFASQQIPTKTLALGIGALSLSAYAFSKTTHFGALKEKLCHMQTGAHQNISDLFSKYRNLWTNRKGQMIVIHLLAISLIAVLATSHLNAKKINDIAFANNESHPQSDLSLAPESTKSEKALSWETSVLGKVKSGACNGLGYIKRSFAWAYSAAKKSFMNNFEPRGYSYDGGFTQSIQSAVLGNMDEEDKEKV